ncbi:MAG: type II toxin-antitoxin system RelE/ParE family toxin [Bryobacteraceae bacterium]
MDFQIRITETALADFEEVLDYSWLNFPAAAERFGNAILNHIDLLKSYPFIGSPVVGHPSVRRLVLDGPYLERTVGNHAALIPFHETALDWLCVSQLTKPRCRKLPPAAKTVRGLVCWFQPEYNR